MDLFIVRVEKNAVGNMYAVESIDAGVDRLTQWIYEEHGFFPSETDRAELENDGIVTIDGITYQIIGTDN